MERGNFKIEPLALAVSLFLGFFCANAVSQQLPDAGSILKEQPKPPAVSPSAPITFTPSLPQQKEGSAEGAKLLVKGFRFKGAVLVPEAELRKQLAPAINQELTLDQLRSLIAGLTVYYAQQGYLARAIIPPQEVEDGIVEIQIVEGKRGEVLLQKEGERLSGERVMSFIDKRLPQNDALSLIKLGETITILNEQPGVSARVDMLPGSSEGSIDLALLATETPLLNYNVGANNNGSYGTGEEQLSGSIVASNPFGFFDAASVLVNKSAGSDFVRGDYSLAIGGSGLRMGINASHLNYEVVPSEFDELDAQGTATTTGMTVTYPLARKADFNLSLNAGYSLMVLKDEALGEETSNRQLGLYNTGLDGYTLINAFGGTIASFGVNYVYGDSNQRNDDALAVDRVSRNAQGYVEKLAYNLGWLSNLSEEVSLNARLSGQFAGTNLDSSQQMSLGGMSGVRAYPTGEASGDEGWLLNVDLSRQLAQNITGRLFYDLGQIKLNHSRWTNWNAANPDLDNRYILSGVGIAMDWRLTQHALMSASIATPLESNPGADAENKNVDGKSNRTRIWLALNASF